jgi:hypothetical protein
MCEDVEKWGEAHDDGDDDGDEESGSTLSAERPKTPPRDRPMLQPHPRLYACHHFSPP